MYVTLVLSISCATIFSTLKNIMGKKFFGRYTVANAVLTRLKPWYLFVLQKYRISAVHIFYKKNHSTSIGHELCDVNVESNVLFLRKKKYIIEYNKATIENQEPFYFTRNIFATSTKQCCQHRTSLFCGSRACEQKKINK